MTSHRIAEVRPTLVALHMCQTRSKTTLAVIKSPAASLECNCINVSRSAASRHPWDCQSVIDAAASCADTNLIEERGA